MRNIHNPVRYEDETQAEYRHRRKDSRQALERVRSSDSWPGGKTVHRNPMRDLGQHPVFAKGRKRTAKPAIYATWPRTKDQHKQTRPLIVVRPLRALVRLLLDATPADKDGLRMLSASDRRLLLSARALPKHALDAAALAKA